MTFHLWVSKWVHGLVSGWAPPVKTLIAQRPIFWKGAWTLRDRVLTFSTGPLTGPITWGNSLYLSEPSSFGWTLAEFILWARLGAGDRAESKTVSAHKELPHGSLQRLRSSWCTVSQTVWPRGTHKCWGNTEEAQEGCSWVEFKIVMRNYAIGWHPLG